MKSIPIFLALYICSISGFLHAQSFDPSDMEEILYGVSYYPEYMPYDRLEEDVRMMKECGINVVRMGESTWAYMEPKDGVFTLDYLGEVLDIMHENKIKVIIGTPTYAFPSWLAKKHPDILLTTKDGPRSYGARQNMDITNGDYLFHAERIIRKLIDYVHDHPAVIGYQTDNETKHYGTEGEHVQELFKTHLKDKFNSPEEMSREYGFHYWSNSVYDWEALPSTVGTINASFRCEFEKFQRQLVTDFLAWQVSIVNEYKKPGQFVTQNFDLGWRNMSYAIQPSVDHFEASKAFDIAGIDIYHATAEELDGVVIGLAGDLARSMKKANYLVIETQAQSINPSSNQRLPFPGQLRMQAFSHIASGANMVAYWPWHSIHNSAETYWKGLLSHDLESNPTFEEAKQIAGEFKRIGSDIMNLKKENKVAIYFSNESLDAIEQFPISAHLKYNDIVHQVYTLLYKSNIECDFVDHTSVDLDAYDVIIVPPLYSASDQELSDLMAFAEQGGNILFCFKSGFSNEHVQVRTERQPGGIREAGGFFYQQFTSISKMPLAQHDFKVDAENNHASDWAELITPEGAEVLARYDHPYWNKYAAIVRKDHGKGRITYMGTWPSGQILKALLLDEVEDAGVDRPPYDFPIVLRKGMNKENKRINYIFNYSQKKVSIPYQLENGIDLITGNELRNGDFLALEPWDFAIVKEK